MGDIGFEEQLEQERLERESRSLGEQGPPSTRVDPDGTTYTWDPNARAWFPKIDSDFIAQYQMNYGVSQEASDTDKQAEDYKQFYQNYYEASVKQQEVLSRPPKAAETEESHEETVQKLATLETHMAKDTDAQYQADSREDMEKYTEEQKKQYNDYWSYYYGTEYHDYYADCMAQLDTAAATGGGTEGKNIGAPDGDNTADKQGGKEGDKKGKKRKHPQPKREEGWFDVSEEHNTNVYVSGLPLDVTEEEFKEMMTKYGLIMNDPRSKKPKLKLYMDENGQPKGDGRCCFIKRESVDLIMNLLDGAEYRGHKIKVELASFTMKGEYDPSKKKKKLTNREKRKLKERQAKLFDWRPDKPRGARMKHEKVVVLKNVFDNKEFEDDPVKMNLLRDRIKAECSKYGEVKKAVVYDRHEDGVVLVHFQEAEHADMCIEYMNQRYLANRRILAATWDGSTKFEVAETEAEREARLKKWVEFLEEGDTSNTKTPATATTTLAPPPTQAGTVTLPAQVGETTSDPAGEVPPTTAVETKASAIAGETMCLSSEGEVTLSSTVGEGTLTAQVRETNPAAQIADDSIISTVSQTPVTGNATGNGVSIHTPASSDTVSADSNVNTSLASETVVSDRMDTSDTADVSDIVEDKT